MLVCVEVVQNCTLRWGTSEWQFIFSFSLYARLAKLVSSEAFPLLSSCLSFHTFFLQCFPLLVDEKTINREEGKRTWCCLPGGSSYPLWLLLFLDSCNVFYHLLWNFSPLLIILPEWARPGYQQTCILYKYIYSWKVLHLKGYCHLSGNNVPP